MSENTQPTCRYLSVYDIDQETLDWLSHTMPGNIYSKPIEEINNFLNKLEQVYLELDQEKDLEIA
tara:strand:+ start:194 stop:388 length:195 start_codon:yes stop_codon:yes gene_type:complete